LCKHTVTLSYPHTVSDSKQVEMLLPGCENVIALIMMKE
jgi:hypothetical protein